VQCESRKNRLGERNTNLRSAPPSHAATADGRVVKHKIECIGNSDGAFHLEAGAPVRQVADSTIDRRPAALKGDAHSLESAAARFNSALLLRVIHCSMGRVEASHSSAMLGIHRHCPSRLRGQCYGRPRSAFLQRVIAANFQPPQDGAPAKMRPWPHTPRGLDAGQGGWRGRMINLYRKVRLFMASMRAAFLVKCGAREAS
jgi:hypothetical protein